MRVLLAVTAALTALVVIAPANAVDSYCSSSGDVCTSVAKLNGVRTLRVGSFAFTGRVKICVKDPKGARVCHSFKLRKVGPLAQAKVGWRANYPYRGHGTYRVTFFYGTTRLGPALSFKA